MDLRIF